MRARGSIATAIGITVILMISGCSGAEPVASASPVPAATVKSTPKPSPTPTQPATKTVTFECRWEEPPAKIGDQVQRKSGTFSNVHDAWAAGVAFTGCDAELSTAGVYSTDETAAVAIAYPDEPLPEKVKFLWGICAQTANFYQTNGPINENQRIEAAGALMLCPDHPSASIMANGSVEQQERDSGLRFGAGVFEVGTRIQPGTYRATGDIENCYWERLDSAGEIIDNNFVSAATQVEVTVQPSDFSAHFSGCGEFVKVG